MKLAIMQPYFLPYIGYFQLMMESDSMVIYDNIEFTKQSWFNRNKFLFRNEARYFTIPVKNDSDYLEVKQRQVSQQLEKNKRSIFGQFRQSYNKAPYFDTVFYLFESLINYESDNLFDYIYHSIEAVRDYLSIPTELIISSSIEIDHSKKNKYKVWAICKKLGYENYINPIGGKSLYSKDEFRAEDINLKFLKPVIKSYQQFGEEFIPRLSIIDIMMFNSPDKIKNKLLNSYTLY